MGHVGSKKRPRGAQDPFLKDLPRDLHVLEIHEPFRSTLVSGRPWSRGGVGEGVWGPSWHQVEGSEGGSWETWVLLGCPGGHVGSKLGLTSLQISFQLAQ